MRMTFCPAHTHLILTCAYAWHFDLCMRISFWPVHAHIILTWACASRFDMRRRISFWIAHGHLILTFPCASHFGLSLRISSRPAHAYLSVMHVHIILPFALAKRFRVAYTFLEPSSVVIDFREQEKRFVLFNKCFVLKCSKYSSDFHLTELLY